MTRTPGRGSATAFSSLAHVAYRHRWKVILGWIAGLVLAGVLMQVLPAAYTARFTLPGSESQKAHDLLGQRFPARSGSSSQIVFHTDATQPPLLDPALTARVTAIVDEAKRLPAVTAVISPFEQPGAISADGHTAFATVQYGVDTKSMPAGAAGALVTFVERSTGAGLTVEGGGQVVASTERGGLGSSEVIGIAAAAVILLLAFGSVVAMGLPIVAALVSLGSSVAVIGVASRFLDMTHFTPSFAAMIGLGVGIDYALLVITRFREGIHSGRSVEDSVGVAVETAGRSVVFAGMIVVISLLGLALIGIPFIGALGVAGAVVVALSVAAALTLLPAVLAIVGKRVDSLGLPSFRNRETDHESSMWFRLSHAIQHRPVWFTLGASAVLGALALPVIMMQTGFTDAGANPPTSHTRRAYDLLSEGFGRGFNGPLTVVIDTREGGADQVPALLDALSKTPNVMGVTRPISNPAGDTAIISVYPGTSPQSAETSQLVHRLRADVIPGATGGTDLNAYVTGATASSIDVSETVASRTPIFFAVVIGLSFIVLMAVFRSVLIPLKAALMNVLSIGAAYGVLVAVFQWGWGASVLGVGQTGPIEPFLPMMMFAIVFGLSMDYEVFLVSRIREEYVAGRKTSEAVSYGLASTARVISSAALIMIAVFASFFFGSDRVIKEFGLGLAAAVFLDATVVRLILVPSLMELFGRANWWLPVHLDRLLPRIHLEVPMPVAPVRAAEAVRPE